MKTIYKLHCAAIDKIEDIYIGVVEFRTEDPKEMVAYIKGLNDDKIDNYYTVEECQDEAGDGKYFLPSDFVNRETI